MMTTLRQGVRTLAVMAIPLFVGSAAIAGGMPPEVEIDANGVPVTADEVVPGAAEPTVAATAGAVAPLISAASSGDRLQAIPPAEPTVTVAIDVTPLDPTHRSIRSGVFCGRIGRNANLGKGPPLRQQASHPRGAPFCSPSRLWAPFAAPTFYVTQSLRLCCAQSPRMLSPH